MMDNAAQKVQQIAQTALGTSIDQQILLGRGATSEAWQVGIGNDDFVVRFIPIGTKRPVTYQSEFTILRLLRAQGYNVPKPVLNSAECQQILPNVPEPWAVTGLIDGSAILKEQLPQQAAKELGAMLAAIHTLPVKHFGRLAEQPGELCGLQSDPLMGTKARWCHAALWPLDGSMLEAHPIATMLSHLIGELQQMQMELMDAVQAENVVLTHSDLHGEHIFVKDQQLAGIIDFGVAFIGNPAWDFASLAFSHGWSVVEDVLTGYTNSAEQRSYLLNNTQKLALAVSLYKLDKALKANAPATKVQRIVAFIEKTL